MRERPEILPMSIRVECPACRRRFSAPERAAGRSARCPACEQRIAIPNPPETSSSGQRAGAPANGQSPAVVGSVCPTCGNAVPVSRAGREADFCPSCPGCGAGLRGAQSVCRRCQLAARQIRWEQQEARNRMPEAALLILEPDELVACVARGKRHVYSATDCRLLIAHRPRRLRRKGKKLCKIVDYCDITGYEEFDDLSDRARVVLETASGEVALEFDAFDEFHRFSVQWPNALALYATQRRAPEYTLISLPC